MKVIYKNKDNKYEIDPALVAVMAITKRAITAATALKQIGEKHANGEYPPLLDVTYPYTFTAPIDASQPPLLDHYLLAYRGEFKLEVSGWNGRSENVTKDHLKHAYPHDARRMRDKYEKGSDLYQRYDQQIKEELKKFSVKIYPTTKEIADSAHIHTFALEGDKLIMSPMRDRAEAARLDYRERNTNLVLAEIGHTQDYVQAARAAGYRFPRMEFKCRPGTLGLLDLEQTLSDLQVIKAKADAYYNEGVEAVAPSKPAPAADTKGRER